MKMIPAEYLDHKTPKSEKLIFKLLREIKWGSNDIALHSLNIGYHEYKKVGEADFIIICEKGILLLEVKGGRVACKDGVWEHTNRFDEKTVKYESPAEQAKSAFYSIQDNYLNRFKKELSTVSCGWAVIFTDINGLGKQGASSTAEFPNETTAFKNDCKGHNSLRNFIEKAFHHYAPKRGAKPLEMTTVEKISQVLRPTFERFPSLNSQLRDFEQRAEQLTNEQVEIFDTIEINDRIIVEGGAGTGKTFVAVACARTEAARHKSVLYLTRSPFLASWLKNQNLPENIQVATLEYVQDFLEKEKLWEVLIVDEGQDFCVMDEIFQIENLLKGGWANGRWRWFGDPNHQVSPSFPVEEECLNYLRDLGVRKLLKDNIRNAGKIVNAIQRLTGADVGNPKSKPSVGQVDLQPVNLKEEIVPKCVSVIRGWLKREDPPHRSEIALLVPSEELIPSALKSLNSNGVRSERITNRALEGNARNCVLVSTIEDFKGLEKPLVCVAGLAPKNQLISNAYKAISRANHCLKIIAVKANLEMLLNNQ